MRSLPLVLCHHLGAYTFEYLGLQHFPNLTHMSPALHPTTRNGKSRLIEVANVAGPSSSSALPPPSFVLILPGNPLSAPLPQNLRMAIFQQLVLAVKRGNNMKR